MKLSSLRLFGVLLFGVAVTHCGGSDTERAAPGAGGTSSAGKSGSGSGGSSSGGTSGTAGAGSGGTATGGSGATDASSGSGGTSGTASGGSSTGGSGATDASTDTGSGDAGPDARSDAAPDTGTSDGGPVSLACTAGAPGGTKATLQMATATFSQTYFTSSSVTRAIDGILDDNRGWAIAPDGSTNIGAQTAAFELASTTPAHPNGTRITFVLTHNFSNPADHALGRFRLSVTTASRDQFADGNDGLTTPGNTGSNALWTAVTPVSGCGSMPVTMSKLGDQSVLVTEHDITPVVYTVIAETPLKSITGVRLEALEDSSLPHSGPGLQDTNGNFVLTEIEVYTAAL